MEVWLKKVDVCFTVSDSELHLVLLSFLPGGKFCHIWLNVRLRTAAWQQETHGWTATEHWTSSDRLWSQSSGSFYSISSFGLSCWSCEPSQQWPFPVSRVKVKSDTGLIWVNQHSGNLRCELMSNINYPGLWRKICCAFILFQSQSLYVMTIPQWTWRKSGETWLFSWPIFLINDVVNLVILWTSVPAMAVASSPGKDQPLLQLQKVDSSKIGGRLLSPTLSSPLETNQPICIPSPYTDLSHDYSSIPFYSPAIFSYAAPSISDCPSVHQSLNPSLFWPSHGHVGPPLSLHHSQTRDQLGQPIQSPLVELSPPNNVLTTR